jgi:hypothetical protein
MFIVLIDDSLNSCCDNAYSKFWLRVADVKINIKQSTNGNDLGVIENFITATF